MTRPWTSDEARARLRENRLTPEQDEQLRRRMGERVRAARELLEASRQDLAEVFGMSVSWAREVELGNVWPPHGLIVCLAASLGMSPSLFYETGDMPDVEREVSQAVAKLAARARRSKPQAVPDAAALLGLSKSYVWRLISEGALVSEKEGRRTVVTSDSLADYVLSPAYAAAQRAKGRAR